MKYEKITKLAKILKNIFMVFILVHVIGLVFLGFPITILILRIYRSSLKRMQHHFKKILPNN